MSEQIGKLITCTRCTMNIFLKQTGTEGLGNYAGPGMRATYEELPETWMRSPIGHLCPSCSKKLSNLLIDFLGMDVYNKLAPCWHAKEDD